MLAARNVFCACVMMAARVSDYAEVNEREWLALPTYYAHAAHVMIYAEWPGKFLGKYDYKYAVSVSTPSSVAATIMYCIILYRCSFVLMELLAFLGVW